MNVYLGLLSAFCATALFRHTLHHMTTSEVFTDALASALQKKKKKICWISLAIEESVHLIF